MDIARLSRIKHNLQMRSKLFRAIRNFFDARDFLEVETNCRIPAPAPEEFIESITADGEFLRASPEIAMKIMVGAGFDRIYQIGRCFRAGEHGRKHREEFTMLEYYAANMNYRCFADLTVEMLRSCCHELFGCGQLTFNGKNIDLDTPAEWISVEEAFQRYCGVSCAEADARDIFDELMVEQIEPKLGQGRLTVLADYPATRASLARLKESDPSYAERWEMYIDGLELANSFGELIDGGEQRRRFEASYEFRRKQNMHEYPVPEDFFIMLNSGNMPECSGGAMGLDRLAMVFADATDIADVRAE